MTLSAEITRRLCAAVPTIDRIARLPPQMRQRVVVYLLGGLLAHRPDAARITDEYIAELQAAHCIEKAARADL